MEKIKVIIADDDDFVREGMRIILSMDPEFEVVGCAENGAEALELARADKVDVVIMDIQMPKMDGIEATEWIVSEQLGRVLILTTFDDYKLVREAIRKGAKGYLIKNHTPDQLKQMIKSVHSGIGVMDERVIEALGDSGYSSAENGFPEDHFTKRELEIIQLIAKGFANKEIARTLFISEGTVKNYISTILEKEDLAHRTALAVYYLTGKR